VVRDYSRPLAPVEVDHSGLRGCRAESEAVMCDPHAVDEPGTHFPSGVNRP